MSSSENGDEWDLFDSMNPDCWREVLDKLPNAPAIVSLATASSDIRSLMEEREELNVALALEAIKVIHREDRNARIRKYIALRYLSTSPTLKSMIYSQLEAEISHKFDVKLPQCYFPNQLELRQFITRFDGHPRSLFVVPACEFNVLSDAAVNLLSQHGRHLRQVRMSINRSERNPVGMIVDVLNLMPNLERLAIYTNSMISRVPGNFAGIFPSLPQLVLLKLSLGHMWNGGIIYSSMIREFGPNLASLSVEPVAFSPSHVDQTSWNQLVNLKCLEVQGVEYSYNEVTHSMEKLSRVTWPQLKELKLPFGVFHTGYRRFSITQRQLAALTCLQNFRETLETIGFLVDMRANLRFTEENLQNVAHHGTFLKLVEMNIAQRDAVPIPLRLTQYFAKVFPNLKRLVLRRGSILLNWRYEHVDHYFKLFPSLEYVKVEKEDGVFIVYKKKSGPPSSKAHLSFLFENQVERILQTLREKLEQLGHIESLDVEIPPEREHAWILEPVVPVDLPFCPKLKRLDFSLVDCPRDMDCENRKRLMQPIVGSLFNSYGDQLIELSTGNEMLYASDTIPWRTLRNLQALRVNLFGDEWKNAYDILSQLECPMLREISFDKEVPFNNNMLRMLKNFKESLSTMRIFGWSCRSEERLILNENVQPLTNLTKLVLSPRLVKDRSKTDVWRTFSSLIPNLRELHFLKETGVSLLEEEDLKYYEGLFETVKEIMLVDESGRQLDQWSGAAEKPQV